MARFNFTAGMDTVCDRPAPGPLPVPPSSSPPPQGPGEVRFFASQGAVASVGDNVLWTTSPRSAESGWTRDPNDAWKFHLQKRVLITAIANVTPTVRFNGSLLWKFSFTAQDCGSLDVGTELAKVPGVLYEIQARPNALHPSQSPPAPGFVAWTAIVFLAQALRRRGR